MDKTTIIENIGAIRDAIARNARDPLCPPKLLPVTKTQPAAHILALRGAGIDAIGENRVQEILEKYPAVSNDFSIHLIGRLQTNKIKYIIGRVCMIQSLDRLSLAQAIDARAQAADVRMPVLIEVNIGGESQKAGMPPASVETFLRACARLPGLHVRGLMAVMPFVDAPETLRPLFRAMRVLFEQMRAEAVDGVDLCELSMGMSGDYLIAAQEGATIVRVGSAIFGARAPLRAT